MQALRLGWLILVLITLHGCAGGQPPKLGAQPSDWNNREYTLRVGLWDIRVEVRNGYGRGQWCYIDVGGACPQVGVQVGAILSGQLAGDERPETVVELRTSRGLLIVVFDVAVDPAQATNVVRVDGALIGLAVRNGALELQIERDGQVVTERWTKDPDSSVLTLDTESKAPNCAFHCPNNVNPDVVSVCYSGEVFVAGRRAYDRTQFEVRVRKVSRRGRSLQIHLDYLASCYDPEAHAVATHLAPSCGVAKRQNANHRCHVRMLRGGMLQARFSQSPMT